VDRAPMQAGGACADCDELYEYAGRVPVRLVNDGAPLTIERRVHTPWRCVECGTRWMLITDEDANRRFMRRI
jgi:hypothetical protein